MFIDCLFHGGTLSWLTSVSTCPPVATERSEGGRTYVLNIRQSGLSPPTVKNILVQGRRDQFLADTFNISSCLFLLRNRARLSRGYLLVAGNIYPGFPVYVPHHATGVQPVLAFTVIPTLRSC
jgi:hypothetical protein